MIQYNKNLGNIDLSIDLHRNIMTFINCGNANIHQYDVFGYIHTITKLVSISQR